MLKEIYGIPFRYPLEYNTKIVILLFHVKSKRVKLIIGSI